MDAAQMKMKMQYPWLAMGHISAYLNLANKFAQRGHKISFFIPKRTKTKFQHFNLYPQLITFITINVPMFSLTTLLMTAMDRTQKDIELLLLDLKPHVVFFDFAYWIPNLTRSLGIKSFHYITYSMIFASYMETMEKQCCEKSLLVDEMSFMNAPDGFPDSSIKLSIYELRSLAFIRSEFGSGVRFYDRMNTSTRLSDAVGFRGCREIEGPYADFLESCFGKPLLLSGPVLPEPHNSTLEEKWDDWLSGFKHGSVIYCAFGSECRLHQDQFKQLLLDLELTGFPFLAALKAPIGFDSVEAAMPEGFQQRVQGRGIVHGGWVQQALILEHLSVGCFITHCGVASLLEAVLNTCQIVVVPNILDQLLNARMISSSLKAGVEVEKGEEDGSITKESVCKAVKTVMDDESEVAREVRANHLKLRNLLLNKDLQNTYMNSFCYKLQQLLG